VQTIDAQKAQVAMFSDPNMTMDMMMKNLSMIVPQVRPNECTLLLLIWTTKRNLFWIWIQIIEKLSAGAPDIQTKIKTLISIAEEHNIKWEPKAFEETLQIISI
jgi:hypothetical protein